MSNDPNNNASFSEKLSNKYRLVIFNNDTFEEINSYQLTLGNIYALISSLFVLIGLIVMLIFFLTPLKRLVPGYGQLDDNSMFISLNEKLDEIDKSIDAHQIYMNSFKRMLTASDDVSDKQQSDEKKLQEAIRKAQNENNDNEQETDELSQINTGGILPNKKSAEYLFNPVQGPITAGFMPGKKHFGVDVSGHENSPINAIQDGYVIISGWDLETGNTIGIQHKDNMISFYKHNSVLLKEEGTFVQAGEAIAIIGNSGTLSDGPHLHFELWHNGNPVDPEHYINFN